MSLKGRIEDVPLAEVTQLISLAEKTGALTIRASPGDGGIVFRRGRVVSAYCWNSPPMDPRAAALTPGQRTALARTRIEFAMTELLRTRDGQFEFVVSSVPPRRIGARDMTLEIADPGIPVQELMLASEIVESA